MRSLFIFIFLFAACTLNNHSNKSQDEFDKILAVMKTKSTSDLFRYYGKPDETVQSNQDKNIQILRYSNSRIDAYIDQSKKDKITHLTIFFFEDFDNYIYLQKRFKNYKWIEKKIQETKPSDVATDRYLVTIPELRISFEYDNHAPKRKVMWIYFD